MVGRDGIAGTQREFGAKFLGALSNRSGAGKPSRCSSELRGAGDRVDGSFQFGKGVRVVLVLRVGLAEKVVDAGVGGVLLEHVWNIFAASADWRCGRVRCPRRRGVRIVGRILPQGPEDFGDFGIIFLIEIAQGENCGRRRHRDGQRADVRAEGWRRIRSHDRRSPIAIEAGALGFHSWACLKNSDAILRSNVSSLSIPMTPSPPISP